MDQLAVSDLPVGVGLLRRGIENRDDRIVTIRSLIRLRCLNRLGKGLVLLVADLRDIGLLDELIAHDLPVRIG